LGESGRARGREREGEGGREREGGRGREEERQGEERRKKKVFAHIRGIGTRS